ncbi:MAG: FecR domain-containing protein [Chthoniobacterales bacterium]
MLSVQGEVSRISAGRRVSALLATDSRLAAGDTLRVSPGARLDLALLPGILMQVAGGSELAIEKLQLAKDGNDTGGHIFNREVRLRLNRGAIIIAVESLSATPAQLDVVTPHAAIRGDADCLFQIRVNDSKTRVTCVRGEVQAGEGNREPSVMGEGDARDWPFGRMEAASRPGDSPARPELSDALKAEEQLRELASQHPPALPD